MSKAQTLLIALGGCILLMLVIFFHSRDHRLVEPSRAEPTHLGQHASVAPRGPALSAQPASTDLQVRPVLATAAVSSPAPVQASVAPLPPELASIPATTVLENMRAAFRNYAAVFGGNPVGTNPEITRALAGDNPKHVNFLKEDGNRVNSRGALVDQWETPYFFHQLSGTDMEIRSAGPDRTMWTSDDLTIR